MIFFNKYVLLWLMVAAIIVGIGSLNCPSLFRLVTRGVSSQGTVIALTPELHNTVRYEYHVAGEVITGQNQCWPPNPPLERLSVGQSVAIYYDPRNPKDSVLGNPKPMLENEIGSVLVAAVMIPTLITFAFAGWWRKHA